MDDFTYDFPDETAFIETLYEILNESENEKEKEIAELINDAECNFSSSSSYSKKRWNAFSAVVHFYLPINKIGVINKQKEIRDILIQYCEMLMPKNAGYDVNWVEFSPKLKSKKEKSDFEIPEFLKSSKKPEGPPTDFKSDKIESRNNKIFVIHGRNDRVRKSMFAFLRAIGLNPIEWTKAVAMTGQATPYIGDVIEKAFSEAQAIIALHTPDDLGRLKAEFIIDSDEGHEISLTGQARQNVIFETGMALGKDPSRTVIVQVGNVRPYSDIGGRLTLRLNDTVAARQAVALRLKTAGCNVNLDGTDWHDVGEFKI